jgi:hypothetical protein
MNDLFDLLRRDHEQARELFAGLRSDRAQGRPASAERFRLLHRLLTAHAQAEESVFYPALERAEATRSAALEALVEHRVVKDLLRGLGRMTFGSDGWWAQLFVVGEYVDRHAREEERDLFRMARRVFDGEANGRLAREFAQARANALASS